MATLNKNTARLIVLCVCVALIALLSLPQSSWPLWAQGALVVALVVVFPLLNALGVLEALGLKDTPGSRFNARHMFTGLAFFAGALVWVWAVVRFVPDSMIGALVVVVPALVSLGTALFFFIKGTLWR